MARTPIFIEKMHLESHGPLHIQGQNYDPEREGALTDVKVRRLV